ncbi:MAG: hypothetical protein WBX00_36095 [Isosphaeraceae bacterium]
MMEFLIFVAVAFSLPVLVLGLLQLVAPQSSLHEGVWRRLTPFKIDDSSLVFRKMDSTPSHRPPPCVANQK